MSCSVGLESGWLISCGTSLSLYPCVFSHVLCEPVGLKNNCELVETTCWLTWRITLKYTFTFTFWPRLLPKLSSSIIYFHFFLWFQFYESLRESLRYHRLINSIRWNLLTWRINSELSPGMQCRIGWSDITHIFACPPVEQIVHKVCACISWVEKFATNSHNIWTWSDPSKHINTSHSHQASNSQLYTTIP